MDAPCDGDVCPTTSLRFPHGGLVLEQETGAKRQLIPENIWIYFPENALHVEPNNGQVFVAPERENWCDERLTV